MQTGKLILAAAVMALSANAANAYFVGDNGYNVGKATVKATGGCAMPAKVFNNARYGSIYESEGGAYYGYGLIDADTGTILATENNYTRTKSIDQTRLSDTYKKELFVYFEDFDTDETVGYIESAAGCDIGELTALSSSKETYAYQGPNGGPGDKESISLSAKLTGFTYRTCETVNNGTTNTEKCGAKPVTVIIQFKGTN